MFAAGVMIAYFSSLRATGFSHPELTETIEITGVVLDDLKPSHHEISRMNNVIGENSDIIYRVNIRITTTRKDADPGNPDTGIVWRMRTTTHDGSEIVDKEDCLRQRLFVEMARVIAVQCERYRTLRSHPEMQGRTIERML